MELLSRARACQKYNFASTSSKSENFPAKFPNSNSKEVSRVFVYQSGVNFRQNSNIKMLRVSEGEHRHREGFVANYRQLHQSLHDLQIAADRVFDTISRKTLEQREKLTDISARIDKAKATIDTLSHSKKPITVTSCSRYPRTSNEGGLPSLFSYKDEAAGGFPVGNLLLNGGFSREFGVDGTLELFQFFSETSAEFHPNEQQEVEDTTHLNGKASIRHHLEAPDHVNEEYSLNYDYRHLPPAPPSLLSRNKQLLSNRRSGESFFSGTTNSS